MRQHGGLFCQRLMIGSTSGQAVHTVAAQTITAEAPLDKMPILVKQGSIVPMGPVVQSTTEQQEPLEIRVYAGKDTAFDWYEDAGDGYAYERALRATVHLVWDEHRQTLSIGERTGTFPGMLAKRTLKLVLVRPGHGVGDNAASNVDHTVIYEGLAIQANLNRTNGAN